MPIIFKTVPECIPMMGRFCIPLLGIACFGRILEPMLATASACFQTGAKTMAEYGASFRQILVYYYPNTEFANLPR